MKTWNKNEVIGMTPTAILDYEMDFAIWLAGGEIDLAQAVAKDCTVGDPVIEGTVVKFRVSDLTDKLASVALTVRTLDGQRDTFTFRYAAERS